MDYFFIILHWKHFQYQNVVFFLSPHSSLYILIRLVLVKFVPQLKLSILYTGGNANKNLSYMFVLNWNVGVLCLTCFNMSCFILAYVLFSARPKSYFSARYHFSCFIDRLSLETQSCTWLNSVFWISNEIYYASCFKLWQVHICLILIHDSKLFLHIIGTM